MRSLWLMVAVAMLAGSGCRKKTAPEYYRLESQVEILVSRDGDEAWGSPEMDQLATGLAAIPPATVEGPKAAALTGRIGTERARVAAERAAALAEASRPHAAGPSMELAGVGAGSAAQAAGSTATAADAGPLVPTPGMELKVFLAAFGDCMDQAPAEDVSGVGKASLYAVKGTPACRERFQVANERSRRLYLFVQERLAGDRTEVRTETATLVDGGATATPAQPPAPQTLQFVPGMPQPGYAPDAQ